MEADQAALVEEVLASQGRDGNRSLTFSYMPLNGDGLRALAARVPHLRRLYLMGTEVTDDGFEAINRFRSLEALDVSETRLTDASVLALDPRLPLRRVALARAQVSAASFAHLARFPTLRELDAQCGFRDRETPAPPIDDALHALRARTDLEEFNVGGHLIHGPGLQAVARMTNLRLLGLSDTQAPAPALASLAGLKNLETLLLRATGLDDATLAALSPLPRLRHLNVTDTRITDASVPTILGFPTLESLAFEDVAVSREAAEALFALPNLTSLEIRIDGVDGEHWGRFARGRKGFHLEA